MDAALRSAYYLVTGSNPDPDAFSAIRGVKGWKEATFTIPKVGDLSVAVVSGLSNARQLMTDLEEGRVHYDFVEVMACPGGCSGGGGQPIHDGTEMAEARGKRSVEHRQEVPGAVLPRESGDPDPVPGVPACPLSGRSHHLLHTDHEGWKMPNQKVRHKKRTLSHRLRVLFYAASSGTVIHGAGRADPSPRPAM